MSAHAGVEATRPKLRGFDSVRRMRLAIGILGLVMVLLSLGAFAWHKYSRTGEGLGCLALTTAIAAFCGGLGLMSFGGLIEDTPRPSASASTSAFASASTSASASVAAVTSAGDAGGRRAAPDGGARGAVGRRFSTLALSTAGRHPGRAGPARPAMAHPRSSRGRSARSRRRVRRLSQPTAVSPSTQSQRRSAGVGTLQFPAMQRAGGMQSGSVARSVLHAAPSARFP